MNRPHSGPAMPSEVDLAGSAVRGSVALSIQWLLNKLATAGSTIIIARFLSPAEYGVARTALSVAVFLALPPLVMGDVLVARSRRMGYWAGTARRLALQIAVACSVLTLTAIPFVTRLVETHDPGWFAALLAVLAVRPVLQAFRVVPFSMVRQQLRFRLVAIIDGGIQFGATAASVAFAAAGAGPAAIVIPQILGEAAAVALYLRFSPRVVRFSVPRKGVRALLWSYIIGAAGQYTHGLVMNIPMVAVVYLTGDYEAGLYGFAFMVAIQANAIIMGRLGVILQPILGRLQREPSRQVDGFMRAGRVLATVSVPVALLQAILAEPLFRILLQPMWEPAIVAFQGLSLMQAFYFAVAPSMACLKAQRRFRTLLVWQLAHLGLSVPAYWAAVHFGGAVGAAWVSALLWAISAPVAVWMCVRFGHRGGLVKGLWIFAKPWVTALPLFGAGYLVVRLLSRWDALGDVVAVAVAGPLLLTAAFAMARRNEPDFRMVVDRGINWIKGLVTRTV